MVTTITQLAFVVTLLSVLLSHPGPLPASTNEPPLLPYAYGYVIPVGGDVFAQPGGEAPVAQLQPGFVWVIVQGQATVDDQLWYRIGPEQWMRGSDIWLYSPSTFQGRSQPRALARPLARPLAVVHRSSTPVYRHVPGSTDEVNPRLQVLRHYAAVSTSGVVEDAAGQRWVRTGAGHYLRAADVRLVEATPRPREIPSDADWIAVNLDQQTLVAYRGDRAVYATLISSGLPSSPTPTGVFRIERRSTWARMASPTGNGHYDLPNVPWSLFFTGPYALHGAYWHDQFGIPRSHGCVNLSPADAYWLFNWSLEYGEPIWVYVYGEVPH